MAQEHHSKRMAEADGKRKKLIEDLEKREKEFSNGGKRSADGSTPMTAAQQAKKKKTDQRNFKEEIEAIRRQLEKEVNEEVKQKATLMKTEREKHQKSQEKLTPRLLLKWKTSEGLDYSEDDIRKLFSTFGIISHISSAIEKKDRRKRILEFESGANAWGAELETGNAPMPEITCEWLQPPVETVKKASDEPVKSTNTGANNLEHMSLDDLEAQIMGGF